MTKQEVYNKVKAHLLEQGQRAIDDDRCVYRGPEGAMCAAGCLLDDKYYDRSFEGASLNDDATPTKTAAVREALVKSGVPEEAIPLVACLQQIHDNSLVAYWSEDLAMAAIRNGLIP